jgi:hypothetical protein
MFEPSIRIGSTRIILSGDVPSGSKNIASRYTESPDPCGLYDWNRSKNMLNPLAGEF